MRITIRVEHNGKFISVPISIRQLRDVYDALYMPDENWHRNLKLNKVDKEVYSFHNKVEWLIHDIIDGGRMMRWQQPIYHVSINDKKGKVIKQKGKWKSLKERSYIVKKPRWRKIR